VKVSRAEEDVPRAGVAAVSAGVWRAGDVGIVSAIPEYDRNTGGATAKGAEILAKHRLSLRVLCFHPRRAALKAKWIKSL